MTDLKVVPLPPPTDTTPTLIAMLEAALERARLGDLDCFSMIAITRGSGGVVSARHSPAGSDRYALLGALGYEIYELHQLIDSDGARATHFLPDEPA